MQEFDDFINQLLEESKLFLERAKSAKNTFPQQSFLHSSLLLSMCVLEACVNSISEEVLSTSYNDTYTVQEQALLLERDVKFDKGQFVLGNSLKISRLTDRVEYLYFKFSGEKLGNSCTWYCNLKQGISIRNRLVHPKENFVVTVVQVENALLAVIDTIDTLYSLIYKKGLPAYQRGITPKLFFEDI